MESVYSMHKLGPVHTLFSVENPNQEMLENALNAHKAAIKVIIVLYEYPHQQPFDVNLRFLSEVYDKEKPINQANNLVKIFLEKCQADIRTRIWVHTAKVS